MMDKKRKFNPIYENPDPQRIQKQEPRRTDRYGSDRWESSLSNEDKESIKKILVNKDAKELNDFASSKAKYLASGSEKEKLSTSQIRNVLDVIQRMKKFDENQLQLIRPKLAYAAGRHKGKVRDFRNILEEAISLTNEKNFDFFQALIEAIVGYHRFHDDKD